MAVVSGCQDTHLCDTEERSPRERVAGETWEGLPQDPPGVSPERVAGGRPSAQYRQLLTSLLGPSPGTQMPGYW